MEKEIIEYYLDNAVGEEKAVKQIIVAAIFNITTRELQQYIEKINKSRNFKVIIGGNSKGNFICTKNDIRKAIKKEIKGGLSRIEKAKIMSEKSFLNGQSYLDLDTLKSKVLETLKVADNER